MSTDHAEKYRDDWLAHVEEVIRSRHYTWLPEGLGGEPVDVAMTYLLADIMHICRRAGLDWDDVLRRARERFEDEERQVASRGKGG
ncbi:MAG: hypothetical protein KY476_00975 [Planctomycetes bacterium]|nr:hypothetical protein [Planctomycetota bacterium]